MGSILRPRPGRAEVFGKELLNSIIDGSPWLLLGLIITGVMQAFAPSQEAIRQHLAGPGLVVIIKGAVLGLVSPLCSCGALPLAVGLAGAGASASAIVAFIVAAQSAGIDSLAFTIGVLGPSAGAARMLAAAAIAIVSGLAVQISMSSPQHHKSVALDERGGLLPSLLGGLRESVTTSFDEVAPAVIFGFVLTSALTAFLPPGGLAAASALGGIQGRSAVLLLALPLQFCEHAAVPLAAALQKAGASGGLAFSVLATMPSMNMASYGVVASVAGPAGAVCVAAAVWLSGIACSFIGDWAGVNVVQIGNGDHMLPEWFKDPSQWIMGAIATFAVFRKLKQALGSDTSDSCCKEKTCKDD